MTHARALRTIGIWVFMCLTAPVACSVYDDGLLPPHGSVAAGSGGARSTMTQGVTVEPSCTSGRAGDARCTSGQKPASTPACEFEGVSGACASASADGVDAGAADLCPDDEAKRRPGVCGCGKREIDSDGDGTPDCVDACPHDALKTAAGACGCGESDADSDRDGTPDCVDACPKDPEKTSVGACGCGKRDVDSDRDGTADCSDGCPSDPDKTGPGICGCGQVDPADERAGALYCVRGQLLHRYSFDGDDTIARDSVGDAHGSIVGGKLAEQSSGALHLGGDQGSGTGKEGYVTLPSAAWEGLQSATFECWVTWRGKGPSGDAAWQRIFDFGDQRGTNAHSYIFLTPSGKGGVRSAFSLNGNGADAEVSVVAPEPLAVGVQKHLAVVVDAAASRLSLYVDGTLLGSAGLTGKLSEITASHLWLGRSNFTDDPAFFGSMEELRIYAAALSGEQLQASFMLGPDYVFRP